MEIRRYDPADRVKVFTVIEAALLDTNANFEEDPDEIGSPIEQEYLESEGDFLVGECEGEIIATGAFRPVRGLVEQYLGPFDRTVAELKRFHVSPPHQRKGYGQQMYLELEDRARVGDFTEIVLNTTSLQTAAQRFYEANGFTEIHREPITAEGRSFADIVYKKSISNLQD